MSQPTTQYINGTKMDFVFQSSRGDLKIQIKHSMFYGYELILSNLGKYIKLNLETLAVLKFVYDNSIKTKVICLQNKNCEVEFRHEIIGIVILFRIPGIKKPGVIFTLTFPELKELFDKYNNILTKSSEYISSHETMGYDTVN